MKMNVLHKCAFMQRFWLRLFVCGAVEAHSCIDKFTDIKFLSKAQLLMNPIAGRFDPKVCVNCLRDLYVYVYSIVQW